jgi:hypothetical protein
MLIAAQALLDDFSPKTTLGKNCHQQCRIRAPFFSKDDENDDNEIIMTPCPLCFSIQSVSFIGVFHDPSQAISVFPCSSIETTQNLRREESSTLSDLWRPWDCFQESAADTTTAVIGVD